jgi:glycosyltransferase involved in cell wall biosynthesis
VKRCLHVFSAPDGGVPEHVLRLAIGLRARGWESWVAGPETASIYEALRAAGIPIAKLPFRGGYVHAGDDLSALRRLAGLMRGHRFDLVYVGSSKAAIFGRLAALAHGVPVVCNPGGWEFDPAFRRGPGRVFSLSVERLLAHRTDAYICVSQSERRVALEHRIGSRGGLHVVHNGAVRCDKAVEAEPDFERFAREGPLAGCVAVLGPLKGLDLLLRAAPFVFARLPEARLAIVGNGPLRPELERQARAIGLDERVRFFSYRGPSARYLQSLDVFVLPSRHEAFPIALVEAMACGVPQITTGVGGTAEAVQDGETGLFCRPNDPAHLADRVVRILGDPDLRARMSETSRERHRRLFSVERMVDQIVEVFNRVAAVG